MIRRRDFITLLGAAAAWPLAAGAQRAMPVIGFLTGNASNDNEMVVPPFRRGIGEQGYVEGHNVEILYRVPEISYDRLRLRALAADLVRRRPAVIFAFGTTASLAAKEATDAIPVGRALGGRGKARQRPLSIRKADGAQKGISEVTQPPQANKKRGLWRRSAIAVCIRGTARRGTVARRLISG